MLRTHTCRFIDEKLKLRIYFGTRLSLTMDDMENIMPYGIQQVGMQKVLPEGMFCDIDK
jgi:hypothetical protein